MLKKMSLLFCLSFDFRAHRSCATAQSIVLHSHLCNNTDKEFWSLTFDSYFSQKRLMASGAPMPKEKKPATMMSSMLGVMGLGKGKTTGKVESQD